MVEARWDLPEPLKVTGLHPGSLWSQGHITIDCESILKKGLAGIISEVKNNAARMGTAEAADFARHAEHCVESIRIFCRRYANAARKAGKAEMARALEVVPFKPAYDFYSALQSVWMVQFVCSALIGERDFAIGRIDRWLLPYC
ncbi:MAG: hypothetical protein J6S21_05845, partial [Victivallales bacterium]|nr:hypothetical protein [Victivallales bacterium]